MRTALFATIVGTLVFVAAENAHANGRFPASNQIVFSPQDQNVMVVRTTYGILPTKNGGKTWNWLCEDILALPPLGFEDPQLGMTANGALIAGMDQPTAGMDVSNDLGCSWSCAGSPLANQNIADIVVRPDTPNVVLAVASTAGGQDAGVSVQVFQSTDNGATWSALGTPLPTDPLTQTNDVMTIEVAKSDPNRLYVTAANGFGSMRKAYLFTSKDKGQTWTKNPVTGFDPTSPSLEWGVYIGAVDPANADLVYLRSSGNIGTYTPNNTCPSAMNTQIGASHIYVTTNAGMSFTSPMLPNKCQLLGLALSEDGSKVFAGSWGDGLFKASRADLAFTNTNAKAVPSPNPNQVFHVQCLATRGNELWACSDEATGFVAGVSTDDGMTFTPKLHLCDTQSVASYCSTSGGSSSVACGSDAGIAYCSGAPLSLLLSMTLDTCTPPDSGSPEAGTNGEDAGEGGMNSIVDSGIGPTDADIAPDAGTTKTSSSSCSCSTVGGGGAATAGLALAGIAVATAFARRRRR